MRQRLLKVQDVNKVGIFGAQDEKLFVEISQKRLAQLGLDFSQVIAQLGQQNAVESAGIINSPTDFLQVRVGGQFNTVDELRQFCGELPCQNNLHFFSFSICTASWSMHALTLA